MQRDIMMTLEEAGSETIGTVIATVKPPDQSEFGTQPQKLVTLGLIRRDKNNLVLTVHGKKALRT